MIRLVYDGFAATSANLSEPTFLEGRLTATLRVTTPTRLAVVPAEAIDEAPLPELAAAHKREET
jgi:hypothetical protein